MIDIRDGIMLAIDEVRRLKALGNEFIDIKPKKKTRTNQQNNALHLYFKFVSDAFNDLNIEYTLAEGFSCRFTAEITKGVWKSMQLQMFGFESTTKINTQQINELIDVFTLMFSEHGTAVNFPCNFDYYLKTVGGE